MMVVSSPSGRQPQRRPGEREKEGGVATRANKSLARLEGARLGEALPAMAPFTLDHHLFYLFTQILGRRSRQLGELLRPFGITVPKWRVLAVLGERPGCTMNQLADYATIDRTTLTRILDQMVGEGLVERESGARDRRQVRLRLAAAGSRKLKRVLPVVLPHNRSAVRDFSPTELDNFYRDLNRVLRNLDPDYDERNGGWHADDMIIDAAERRQGEGG
jgi:DNA-binding MarR family transcriptional regulator